MLLLTLPATEKLRVRSFVLVVNLLDEIKNHVLLETLSFFLATKFRVHAA